MPQAWNFLRSPSKVVSSLSLEIHQPAEYIQNTLEQIVVHALKSFPYSEHYRFAFEAFSFFWRQSPPDHGNFTILLVVKIDSKAILMISLLTVSAILVQLEA